jgi:hypothetical protein
VTPAVRLRQSETGRLTSVLDIVKVLCISGKGRRVYRFLLRLLISELNEHKCVSRVVRPSATHVVSLTVEVIGNVGKLQFDHVQILLSTVCQTVARGTPLGFREEISMIAKYFSARANRQFVHLLELSSFPTHMCSVPDIERLPTVLQEME